MAGPEDPTANPQWVAAYLLVSDVRLPASTFVSYPIDVPSSHELAMLTLSRNDSTTTTKVGYGFVGVR